MSDDLNMAPQLTLTPEADAAAAAAPSRMRPAGAKTSWRGWS